MVVEALNPDDNGPVLLQTNDDAAAFLWRAGRSNTGLQFDAYHAAMIGRDPVAELEAHFAHVRHVQIADCPGRGERGTGKMDVDGFLGRARPARLGRSRRARVPPVGRRHRG